MSDGLNLNTLRDNLFNWVNAYIQRPGEDEDDITVTWAEGESGVAGISSDVLSPQPQPPYLSMSLNGPFKSGSDTIQYNSSDDNYTITGHRRFTLEIQSFGVGAMQDLLRLQGIIQSPNSILSLRQNGISINNVPDVNNITTSLQSKFQERAIIEISIYVAHQIISCIGSIEGVDLYFNTDRALLESSDFALLESGNKILLESTKASFTVEA